MPQASIVHDRFHASKHLNEAVDIVRRAEAKALAVEKDGRLTGTRQLWLYHSENIPESRQPAFEELKKSDLKVAQAWAMKENFRAFWNCACLAQANAFFTKWHRWVSLYGSDAAGDPLGTGADVGDWSEVKSWYDETPPDWVEYATSHAHKCQRLAGPAESR